ncbi:PA1571 family protein [Azorhizophilus paspali]
MHDRPTSPFPHRPGRLDCRAQLISRGRPIIMCPCKHRPQRHTALLRSRQPSGGAVINEQGREIPITEGMIQKACRLLDKTWAAAARQAPVDGHKAD